MTYGFFPERQIQMKASEGDIFTQCIWSLVARILFAFTLFFLCFLNLTAEKQGIYPLTDRKGEPDWKGFLRAIHNNDCYSESCREFHHTLPQTLGHSIL